MSDWRQPHPGGAAYQSSGGNQSQQSPSARPRSNIPPQIPTNSRPSIAKCSGCQRQGTRYTYYSNYGSLCPNCNTHNIEGGKFDGLSGSTQVDGDAAARQASLKSNPGLIRAHTFQNIGSIHPLHPQDHARLVTWNKTLQDIKGEFWKREFHRLGRGISVTFARRAASDKANRLRPTVIVSCGLRQDAERIYNALGQTVLYCDRFPRDADVRLKVMDAPIIREKAPEDLSSEGTDVFLLGDVPPHMLSLCGTRISCRGVGVIGGFLRVNGKVLALTTNQVFESTEPPNASSNEKYPGAVGPLTPAQHTYASRPYQATVETVYDDDGSGGQQTRLAELYQYNDSRTGGLSNANSSYGDWALADVTDDRYYHLTRNCFKLPSVQEIGTVNRPSGTVDIEGVENEPQTSDAADTWILGPNGPIEAEMLLSKASILRPGFEEWMDVFTVIPKGSEPVDELSAYAGAWVVSRMKNTLEAKVYGHVVDVRKGLPFLHVVPMATTFNEIQRTGCDVSLPGAPITPRPTWGTPPHSFPSTPETYVGDDFEEEETTYIQHGGRESRPSNYTPERSLSNSHLLRIPPSQPPFRQASNDLPRLSFQAPQSSSRTASPPTGTQASLTSYNIRASVQTYNQHVASCKRCSDNEGFQDPQGAACKQVAYSLKKLFNSKAHNLKKNNFKDDYYKTLPVNFDNQAKGPAREYLRFLNMIRKDQFSREEQNVRVYPSDLPTPSVSGMDSVTRSYDTTGLDAFGSRRIGTTPYPPAFASAAREDVRNRNPPRPYPSVQRSFAKEEPRRRF